MNKLAQLLGLIAKAIGVFSWSFGALLVLISLSKGNGAGWEIPVVTIMIGAFWWGVGLVLEYESKKS